MEKYYSIKFDPEDFKKATSRLFLIMRDYMFVEGKVENWIVVVNTNDLSFHEIPLGVNIYFIIFKNIIQIVIKLVIIIFRL